MTLCKLNPIDIYLTVLNNLNVACSSELLAVMLVLGLNVSSRTTVRGLDDQVLGLEGLVLGNISGVYRLASISISNMTLFPYMGV